MTRGQSSAPADPVQQICDRADATSTKRDWDAALPLAMACEKAARAANNTAQLARGLYLRGRVFYYRDQTFDSLAAMQEASDTAKAAGNMALHSRALGMIQACYATLGDWPASIDYANRSYEASPNKNDPKVRLNLIEARAWAAMELHDRDASLKGFDEALTLARTMDDSNLAWIQSERGLAIYRLTRDVSNALAAYEEALALARKTGDKTRQRNVLNNSGNIFREPGTYAEAERRYAAGLAVAKADGAKDAFLLKNLGIVYRETGRRAEGERLLQEALATADTNGIARIQWQARMELGTFYRNQDAARATKYFEECLDQLEAVHSNILLEDYSAGALSGAITIYDDPYDLFIDHLVKQKDAARAFQVAERARARAFLDTLSGARDAIIKAVPRSYIDGERKLLQAISKNQAKLRAGGAAMPDRGEVEKAIAADEEQLAALRVRLSNEHPEIAHARFPHLIDAAAVQHDLLKPDEAMIEYFVGAESTTLWVIRQDGLWFYELEPRAQIDAAVREYVATISTPDKPYESMSRTLADRLIPGGADLIGHVKRLIVVPHGILNYLPFETLQLQDGRFLTEAYAVSYAPSAATLSFLRSLPARNAGGVVAVGDPVLTGDGDDTRRGVEVAQLGLLKPLKYTEREIASVETAFPGAEVLEQQHASESELHKANLANASIVHFATHGLIDEEFPQRSGLVLTASSSDDGLLQMREIYGLGLNGALVTLSACNTALGKDVTGEGIIGLTRAFIHGGASTVLGTLWNVDDASTSDFMAKFYASLSHGASADEAAQAARHAFLAGDPRLRHPYYWGPFIVTGRASSPVAVTVVSQSRVLYYILLIVLVAAGLVYWLGRGRAAARVR